MIEQVSNSIIKPSINEQYMRIAVDQAKIAEENGDVPIGAVTVYKNQIIAKAYNQREQLMQITLSPSVIQLF